MTTDSKPTAPIEFFIGFRQEDGTYRYAVADRPDYELAGYTPLKPLEDLARQFKQEGIPMSKILVDYADKSPQEAAVAAAWAHAYRQAVSKLEAVLGFEV